MGLVELLGKFDLVMNEHVRRVMSRETHVHYCGKTIQNEIINIIGNLTRDNILSRVRKAKYDDNSCNYCKLREKFQQIEVNKNVLEINNDRRTSQQFSINQYRK